jgi:hypothetical protein
MQIKNGIEIPSNPSQKGKQQTQVQTQTNNNNNKKLKVELPYIPAIPQLDIYLKECKQAHHRDTCTSTFITALFTIAKLWNQLRYRTTNEWLNCGTHIHWSTFSNKKNENEWNWRPLH